MRTILWPFAFFAFAPACAQGFNRIYPPTHDLFPLDVDPCASGYRIISGLMGVGQVVVWQIDEAGDTLWHNEVGSDAWEFSTCYQGCADSVPGGGTLLAGRHGAIDPFSAQQAMLVRLDEAGDTLWTRRFEAPDSTVWGYSCRSLMDGGSVLLAGQDTLGQIHDPDQGLLIRTDGNGAELWRTHLHHRYTSCDRDGQGGFYLVGEEMITSITLARVDSSGHVLWEEAITAEDEPAPFGITTSDGDLIVMGLAQVGGFVARYAGSDGHLLWMYHALQDVPVYGMLLGGVATPPGRVAICGSIHRSGAWNGVLLGLTEEGDSLWQREYLYADSAGHTRDCVLWSVTPAHDGGLVAVGGSEYYENGHGYPADWVIKVDSLGCIIPGCSDLVLDQGHQVMNMQDDLLLYPDPAHDVIYAHIDLPPAWRTAGPLVLSLTAASGGIVRQQRVPSSAFGPIEVDVSDLAPGTYALHLSDAHTWIAGRQFVVGR